MARKNANTETVTETSGPTEVVDTTSAPMEDITIQGLTFSAPAPFAAGHVLTAIEAGVLNQTYQENLRNNFAPTVRKAREASELPEGSEGHATFDEDALREAFAKYAAEYKFGVRKAGAAARDPVMSRAMITARKIIKEALKQEGYKLEEVADQVDELAEAYLKTDDGQVLVEAARQAIEKERELTTSASKLNLSGLGLSQPAAAAE